MEVIFTHHLSHQRDIIGTIGRARRKWKRLYHWFPEEQRRLYQEMDRVYEETIKTHNKEMFSAYGQERRLNKRILKLQQQKIHNTEYEYFEKFPSLKPILDKYDNFPLLYYNEECGSPDYCQQLKNSAM